MAGIGEHVDLGFWELMMLAVLALMVFGPERLPGMARTAGRVVGHIRREVSVTFDALKSEVDLDEVKDLRADLQREKRELASRARLDARSTARRADAEEDAAAESPRFDPDAT